MQHQGLDWEIQANKTRTFPGCFQLFCFAITEASPLQEDFFRQERLKQRGREEGKERALPPMLGSLAQTQVTHMAKQHSIQMNLSAGLKMTREREYQCITLAYSMPIIELGPHICRSETLISFVSYWITPWLISFCLLVGLFCF